MGFSPDSDFETSLFALALSTHSKMLETSNPNQPDCEQTTVGLPLFPASERDFLVSHLTIFFEWFVKLI